MKGIAKLHRWTVAADRRRQFIARWRTRAQDLKRQGALGAYLLQADNDEFVGVVRWPSEWVYERAAGSLEDEVECDGVRALLEAQLSIEVDLSPSSRDLQDRRTA
jgi:heme-degrading monooxygenase HmoA